MRCPKQSRTQHFVRLLWLRRKLLVSIARMVAIAAATRKVALNPPPGPERSIALASCLAYTRNGALPVGQSLARQAKRQVWSSGTAMCRFWLDPL